MDHENTEQQKDVASDNPVLHTHHEARHHADQHSATHGHHVPSKKNYAEEAKSLLMSTNSKVFFIYLAISLIMFWNITLNITSVVINGYGDVHQSLFNLWWVPYSLFTLHQSPYFTNLLYYPIGANLATQTLSPVAALLIAPIYALSASLAYNVLFFLGYALSGLFMFLLAKYITKNNHASFIAGLIFAFAPVHIAQSVAHLDWTMVEWIPAFILFYMLTLREKKLKYAALAAVSLFLLTFMGDIQQGLLMVFFAIVLTILMAILERDEILKVDTLKAFGIFAGITFVISLPILLLILPYINSGALSVAQQNSLISSNMQWSDNLASFFLPSFYNGIFNGVAHSYTYIYQLTYQGIQYTINIGERVSYIGYSVLVLTLLGIYYDYKKSKLKNSLLWIAILFVFGLLSLGPYLQIGNTVTSLPGPFLLFRNIPIFNIIREPGRLDFITMLAIAVIAALGFSKLVQDKDRKTSYRFLIAFTILILIEYNGMPLTPSYISNSTTSGLIPSAYSEMSKVPGNFSVLILPALSNPSSTPNQFTGIDTYYASAIKKPIIGGYTSRENTTQQLAVSSIPLVTAAWYLEIGYPFAYPSPIVENFTNLTNIFLANDHTAFIAVQRQAYNNASQYLLYNYLSQAYGAPIYQSNSTFVYSTSHAINSAGTSIAAYTVGTWISGFNLFCNGALQPCNSTLAGIWWGNNTRGIYLYAPRDENVKMKMTAVSTITGLPIYVFLNGNPAKTINLTGTLANYQVNMTVQGGFSLITFYMQNNSVQQNQYLGYGIKNLSFST